MNVRAATRRRHQTPAFTLVELLVVIAIIGILVALLLPAVQAARAAARRTTCLNKFKQVGIALHSHLSAQQAFPAGMMHWDSRWSSTCVARVDSQGHGHGWGTFLLPYLEEQPIYDQIDFSKHYADANGQVSAGNFLISGTTIEAYLCPSDPQRDPWVSCCSGRYNGSVESEDMGRTNMCGVADTSDWTCNNILAKHLKVANGIMANYRGARSKDIQDGMSKTLMIGEVTGAGAESHQSHFWAQWNILDTKDGINGPFTMLGGQWNNSLAGGGMRNTGFSSFHPGGCHFTNADGSVLFLSENITPNVMCARTTRAGHEVYSEDAAPLCPGVIPPR